MPTTMRQKPGLEEREERPRHRPKESKKSLQEKGHKQYQDVLTSKTPRGLSKIDRGRPQPLKSRSEKSVINRLFPKKDSASHNAYDGSVEIMECLSQPDDIFDIEERYTSMERSCSDFLSSSAQDSRDEWTEDAREVTSFEGSLLSSGSSESGDDDDDDDDNEEVDDEKKKPKESYMDPLDQLMNRLQINGLVKKFQQAGSMRKLLEVHSAETIDSMADEKEKRRQRKQQQKEERQRSRMKEELERESRLAEKLERKLKEKEKEFSATLAAKNQKLATLESKIRLQEQLFDRQLEAERENWVKRPSVDLTKEFNTMQETIFELEKQAMELKQAKFWLQQENASERKAARQKFEALEDALLKMEGALTEQQEVIIALEKKTIELNQENVWLQQEHESEMQAAEAKVLEVEEALLKVEEELDEQRTETMQLEIERNKDLLLFEIEKRKMRLLEQAETKVMLEFLREQKRSQYLVQVNEKIKASLRKKYAYVQGATIKQQPSKEMEEHPPSTPEEKDERQSLIPETLDNTLDLSGDTQEPSGQIPEDTLHNTLDLSGETPEESGQISEETLNHTLEVSGETPEASGQISEETLNHTLEVFGETPEPSGQIPEDTLNHTLEVSGETPEPSGQTPKDNTLEVSEETPEPSGQIPEDNLDDTLEVSGETPEPSGQSLEETLNDNLDLSVEAPEPSGQITEETLDNTLELSGEAPKLSGQIPEEHP